MKLPKSLAGHEFADDLLDSQCIREVPNGEPCRATRAMLFTVVSEDVGKSGIAHTLSLSSTEYNDIETQRKLFNSNCEKLMDALRSVCSG